MWRNLATCCDNQFYTRTASDSCQSPPPLALAISVGRPLLHSIVCFRNANQALVSIEECNANPV